MSYDVSADMEKDVLKKLRSGARVRVTEKIKEGGKERLGNFEGILIARKHGSEPGATFTLRNVVAGVGVEKVVPIHSPNFVKVQVLSEPKRVRRSKIYYIRRLSEKQKREKIR